MQLIHIDPSYSIGLAQIEPIAERTEQRKKQSLTCREILKQLLEFRKLNSEIRKDERNKCHLVDLPYHISFTHADCWCAAGLHLQHSIGIDIEKVSKRPLKIASKFLQESEILLCQNDNFFATAMWCAKEAIYKKYSPKIRHWQSDIQIQKIDKKRCQVKVQLEADVENCKVALRSIDNFILAYTCTTSTELESNDM